MMRSGDEETRRTGPHVHTMPSVKAGRGPAESILGMRCPQAYANIKQ